MAINSRNKGNKAERVVAKLLEGWTGKEFARTPSSGGLQWKSTNSKGDIVCTSEGHLFPFCVEVKHHEKVDFNELLIGTKKTPKIIGFWEQCIRDAKLAKKAPLLIFRYNNLPKDFFFVILETSLYLKLKNSQKGRVADQELFHVRLVKYKLTILTTKTLFQFDYRDTKNILKPLLKRWRKEEKKA